MELRPPDVLAATMTAAPHEIGRGSIIAGRYEVIEEIGSGGMGRVFKVFDRRMHEVVAVKTIRPEIASDAQALERFDNEIRLARKIAHKNVARMFDVGEDDGTPYITMEYVSGEDLRSLIQRIGLLPIGKALAIGRQIASGLNEAHALGIIHRDLKPHNIMIDREGNARIMDFGIARFIKTKRVTEVGVLIGTPEYMSPEQIEGLDSDARSDIYALGVMLYEMVTGRLPFQGETPLSVAVKQKTAVPIPPRSVNEATPLALNAIILKCLEKKPDNRFQKASALAAELAEVEKSLSTAERAVPIPPPRPTRDVTIQFNPRRVVVPIGVILGLAAVAVGVWFLLTRPGSPTARPAERPGPADVSNPAAPVDPLAEAIQLETNGQPARAWDLYKSRLKDSPEDVEAWLGAARTAEKLGRTTEALSDFAKAGELKPDDPRPALALGALYEKAGNRAEAARRYRDYIRLAPDGEDASAVQKKLAALAKADVPETEPVSVKAAPVTPAPPRSSALETALLKAQAALTAGNPAEASKYGREALARDSGNVQAQEIVRSAETQLAEREIIALVGQYNKALDENLLPAFYQAFSTPALAGEVRRDAETVARLFLRFQSTVGGIRVTWTASDTAEVGFEHKLIGFPKEGGAEQILFQGTMKWNVEKASGRWIIARIVSTP
ncbi:MAG: protein kinase [Acidobacteriota bacterium]|nr:protein kinase [Acidobacteriota bacterium]